MQTLSSDTFPPFLKWGNYKSEDPANPDRITVQVMQIETFETEYGVNVNALVDGTEMAIPLQNFNSLNTALFRMWTGNIKNRKIRQGVKFVLCTHLGKSRNGRTIRKWSMEFDS